MLLRRLLPILVVLAGLSVVALLGHGWVVRDRDARREEVLDASRSEGRALLGGAESALGALAVELRTGRSGVVRHLTDAGEVLPSSPPAPFGPRVRSALDLGARLAEAGEGLRAIDALTIPVAGLTDARAKDRLLLEAGRVALANEETRALGISLLTRLSTNPDLAGGTEPPTDLVAALALPSDVAPVITGADLRARIEKTPPAVLAALTRRFASRPGWIGDPDLETSIATGLVVDRIVRAAAEPIARGVPAFVGDRLLLPTGERTDHSIAVAVGSAPGLLPIPARPFTATWGPPNAVPTVSVEGTPVASLTLTDPTAPSRLAAINTRATRLLILLCAVLSVVGVAICATWFAIDRQRRLAALKMRLLANVSHELKTPVTSLRMFGELLESGELPPEKVQEFGARITRESQRLGTRIEEILETARGERSSAPLHRSEVSVRAVVGEVVDGFRARVGEAEGSVALEVTEPSPTIETNRDALERIVENLLDNALKYGRNGSGGPRIEVRVAADTRGARIEVEDRGPGISRDERARIFEPFYRARFDDYAVTGSGLGLSISRSFAERLGGSLEHETPNEGGSRFTLILPTTCLPQSDDGAGA